MYAKVVLVLSALLTSTLAIPQSPNDISGAWKVTTEKPGPADKKAEEGSVILIRQSAGKYEAIDLNSQKRFSQVEIQGEGKWHAASGQVGPGTLDPEFNRINGSLEGKKLVGTIRLQGRDMIFEATRLPSFWLCSNHKPVHTAISEEQMKDLTKGQKCEGWKRSRPEHSNVLWGKE